MKARPIKSTDIDDIAGMISDLSTMIDQRFEQVDQRFEQIDQRFEQVDQRFEQIDQHFKVIEADISGIHKEQREMREWLERIDAKILGVESDIKEVYDRIVVLESMAKHGLTASEQRELARKFERMLAWAQQVSKATGVPLPKL